MKRVFSINCIFKALLCITASFGYCSCDDFVDVVPKGNTIPSTVEDLARLMNNGSMATSGEEYEIYGVSYGVMFGELFNDDITCTDDPNNPLYATIKSMTMLSSAIKLEPFLYGAAESDLNWDHLYHSNYIANYVLANIDKVAESSSISRAEVKGRALVFRAMNYFLLVNIYGRQYEKGSANDAPGVPLILEPDVNAKLPRATVREVYSQIMKDLDDALGLLAINVSRYNNLPSRAAAFALRARVNLWMQNYDEAYNDALAALELKNTLIDYNTLSQAYPGLVMYGIIGYDTNIETNPEILWSRFVSEHFNCCYSQKFASIVDKQKDLRHKIFMGDFAMAGMNEEMCWIKLRHSGIDVSEVYLTKAEAAARKSSPDLRTALATLNSLRKNRYVAATYADFRASDTDAVINEILTERRKEFAWTELGFFEKKRHSINPKYAQPLERIWDGQTYSVPVGDERWQKAIPLNVIEMNKLLEQNKY